MVEGVKKFTKLSGRECNFENGRRGTVHRGRARGRLWRCLRFGSIIRRDGCLPLIFHGMQCVGLCRHHAVLVLLRDTLQHRF